MHTTAWPPARLDSARSLRWDESHTLLTCRHSPRKPVGYASLATTGFGINTYPYPVTAQHRAVTRSCNLHLQSEFLHSFEQLRLKSELVHDRGSRCVLCERGSVHSRLRNKIKIKNAHQNLQRLLMKPSTRCA